MAPEKVVNASEGLWFLISEVIFCAAFLSSCEIPNWVIGPRSPNECFDRWMYTAGLVFIPSGMQAASMGNRSNSRTTRTSPHTGPGKQ